MEYDCLCKNPTKFIKINHISQLSLQRNIVLEIMIQNKLKTYKKHKLLNNLAVRYIPVDKSVKEKLG